MESLLIPRTRPPLHLLPRIGRSRIRSSSGGGSRASTIATARTITSTAPAWLAAAVLFASLAAPSPALDPRYDVPQTLSGEDKKGARIQRPKSRLAERCVGKCVTTCILGGAGSPGAEGPLNVRRYNLKLLFTSLSNQIVKNQIHAIILRTQASCCLQERISQSSVLFTGVLRYL
ncbi:uncharacterized protein LOC121985567 isoform X1 [Zingiber officinale]|uniref:uncharacterized protein LOC121985567 isoform X1 n=1 Tax=Zingiber officinale TaxID=94328 RepID=UPI001C4CCD86|nr:uncharacterized protein LOC121985567 isoform X1 [Zingiber officinale]